MHQPFGGAGVGGCHERGSCRKQKKGDEGLDFFLTVMGFLLIGNVYQRRIPSRTNTKGIKWGKGQDTVKTRATKPGEKENIVQRWKMEVGTTGSSRNVSLSLHQH